MFSDDELAQPGAETLAERSGIRRRKLDPPRRMTGRERRWLDPNRGVVKLLERQVDRLLSRYLYPRLHLWNPYSRLLARRFCVGEISLAPPRWPRGLEPLRVLLISDIHTGPFLEPAVVARTIQVLGDLKPDLVAIAGDIVTGTAADLDPFLDSLAPLSRAPLGAWYCLGNHDYFSGDAAEVCARLRSIGITTLKNEAVVIRHRGGEFTLGGIDDMIFGIPDWEALLGSRGAPHLLLAHHPDFFYEAQSRGVALVLSGHTHGGQIRLANGPPLIRQSRFCLDEGAYSYEDSLLVVSRGFGTVGLPWRYGADPEALLIEILAPTEGPRSGAGAPGSPLRKALQLR